MPRANLHICSLNWECAVHMPREACFVMRSNTEKCLGLLSALGLCNKRHFLTVAQRLWKHDRKNAYISHRTTKISLKRLQQPE